MRIVSGLKGEREMKITQVEARPFSIPMKITTKWARGSQSAAEHVLVKVSTDEGIIGFAEAPPRPTIYGESTASIKFAIDNWLAPSVIGKAPFEMERIWEGFDRIPANNTAKGAIDIAVHDILGKMFNLPCHKLLGGWIDRIRMSWCVNLNPIAEMVKEAQDMITAYGFKTLKLKVGVDPVKDLAMVRAMRKELGDDVMLYVDVNQGYDPYTAVRVLNQMMESNIVLAE
jgi:L-alanine-DL-glutamate epimerase-like enolase superfamily enzyme